MKKYKGRLSFATDAWTSPNHRAFVAITVHLVNSGKPLWMVLDIVQVPVSHTSVNLAQVLTRVLNNFGISDKVSAFTQVNVNYLSLHIQILLMTCDNATNNDTMVAELAHRLPEYSVVNHSRCFLHIINLVAKSVVKQFDEAAQVAAAIDVEVEDEVEPGGNADDDVEEEDDSDPEMENTDPGDPEKDWVDEHLYLGQEERVTLNEVTHPVRHVLSKVTITLQP